MARLPKRAAFWQTQGYGWALCLGLICAAATAGAASLQDLLNQKDLTPEGLARVIAGFTFEQTASVQAPDTFLEHKRGDCADFSNLASTVLTRHGYTTKMVVVMMAQQTHVVCYVKEAGGFLDYNHRADAHPVIASDGSIEDIALKVASDFRSKWRMASIFRYRGSDAVYLETVFATAATQTRLLPAKSVARVDASAPVGMQAVIH